MGIGSGRGGTGSNNVFLGKFSGYGETGSNKLIIENNYLGSDNNTNALIYGEFDNRKLRFNANVGVNTDAGTIKLSSVDDKVSNDDPAILGQHNVTPYWGLGVKGVGGYIGVKGESTIVGVNTRIGVYGTASGGATNWGVYGDASGGTAYAGYFNGNVYAIGYITAPSDRNLKKNILPLSGSLKKVLDLQGVMYEWKSEMELASFNQSKKADRKESEPQLFNFPKGTQLGVIAQDVEKVVPELVHTDADGLKSVDYIKIIPLLIEAIKEQQKQIEGKQQQIESAKQENSQLKSELQSLIIKIHIYGKEIKFS